MKTLRLGSGGEDVKKLQTLLKIEADGIFGQKTKKAVMVWQSSHGLAADGIVGEKTWAALLPSLEGLVKLPIATHVTKAKGRQVKYIAVHYTAGASSKAGSARAVRNVFLKRNASADYVVDDHEIVQINPDPRNYYCWAVGDRKNPLSNGGKYYGMATNRNTISIEVCSTLKGAYSPQYPNHGGWQFTDAVLRNTHRLIRHLMKEYGLDKYRVIRHYDVSGKLCPGIIGWNDGMVYSNDGKVLGKNNSTEWQKFWAEI